MLISKIEVLKMQFFFEFRCFFVENLTFFWGWRILLSFQRIIATSA